MPPSTHATFLGNLRAEPVCMMVWRPIISKYFPIRRMFRRHVHSAAEKELVDFSKFYYSTSWLNLPRIFQI
jgi:hypothetical protein